MRRILLVLLLNMPAAYVFSQGEIPVDMYTGQPSISIPVTAVTSVDVSQPIVLSYNVNATQQSWFGVGWNLQAGGSITREVRGLPDDFGFEDSRKGWLYDYASGTVASSVTFTPGSDTLSSTYGSEATDFAILDGYGDIIDTEPDVFNYNLGGLSGKFVFDNSNTSFTQANISSRIRTIPYRDIKIEPTFISSSDRSITSFKITTNDGYSYTFSAVCTESRRLINKSGWADLSIFTNEYKQYLNTVMYGIEWMLTEIKSPAGNTITYTYTYGNIETDIPNLPVEITMYKEDNPYEGLSTRDYMSKTILEIESSRDYKIPSTITGSTGSFIEFTYNTTDKLLESIALRDTRKGSTSTTNLVKTFTSGYVPVNYMLYEVGQPRLQYTRSYLRTFTESSGCDQTLPYTFNYQMTNSRDDLTGTWSVTISGYNQDEWRYYVLNKNAAAYPIMYIYTGKSLKDRYQYKPGYGGSGITLDGDDREPDNAKGYLTAIDYPAGGRTTFSFDQHRYHEPMLNASVYSTGLRIREISYSDGTQHSPITKKFEYLDAAGKSSGKIFRKPTYYLPAYQWKDLTDNSTLSYAWIASGDRYKYLTIRTLFDLAPRDADNTVGYSRVKVSRTGSGYAVHEFLIPATYGQDKSGMWETPVTKIARKTSSVDLTNSIFPTGGTWRFPHAPNPFYDYARGLSWRVSEYAESGKLVKRTRTTYQKISRTDTAATLVYGLRYDHFPLSEDGNSNNRAYLFSKYFLLTDQDVVPLMQTDTLYDANETGATKYVTNKTEYTYGSSYPKLLKEVKQTAVDGNIYRTKFKYPKDYTNQSSGENAVQMLNILATTFRHGSPIETVNTLQKPAGSELVTGASVVKYEPFTMLAGSIPMLQSQWALEIDAPISDFTNSSVINSSGYKFSIDTRYRQQSAILSYKGTGVPVKMMSPVTRDSAETALAYSNSLPIVKAVKATAAQTAFSDFDNTTDFSWSFGSGTQYWASGRTGTALYPSVPLYKNNIQRISGTNYILSFWIKSTSDLTFTYYVKGGTGSPTYLTNTSYLVPSTSGVFKYVEIPIAVSGVLSSVKLFRIEFVANSLSAPTVGFTAPVIDDVFFYPEGTHLESYTYQIPYGVASITTGEGGASSVEYDELGREKFVRDRDGNIVKKTSYVIAGSPSLITADFWAPDPLYINASANFRARTQLSCLGTITYEWDWGSGYVTGTQIQAHTFTSTGTKTIKLRVSAVGYTAVEKTVVREVLPTPITANICAEGVYEFNATTGTVTTSFADCAYIATAPPSYRTTFQLFNIGGCTDDCTYQWVRRENYSQPWLNVGTNSTQYTCEKIVTNTNSFQIGCMIKRGTEEPVLIGPMDIYVTRP